VRLRPGTGAADHVTDFDEGSTLAVSGSATIGANNSQSRVNLTIANGTAVVAHVTELNVGYNATGSGGITGNLTVTSGASLDAADVASLSIGRETGAANVSTPAANGSLILGNQSTITLGTANALATLNIGWSQNTNSYYATGSASGLLDATEGSFTAMLDTLRIGQTANVGSASGQFIMGAGSSVTTRSADIGMGSGGNGTLTVLGDALTFTGADSALNFGTGTLEVPGTTFTVGVPRLKPFRLCALAISTPVPVPRLPRSTYRQAIRPLRQSSRRICRSAARPARTTTPPRPLTAP
jgi:hypothetical protein